MYDYIPGLTMLKELHHVMPYSQISRLTGIDQRTIETRLYNKSEFKVENYLKLRKLYETSRSFIESVKTIKTPDNPDTPADKYTESESESVQIACRG